MSFRAIIINGDSIFLAVLGEDVDFPSPPNDFDDGETAPLSEVA